MADERVRRALAHAIDSTALVAGGDGRRSRGGARRRDPAGHARATATTPACRSTPSARASCWPRRATRAARACRSCASTRGRGRPPAALAAQLAADRRARALRGAGKHFGVAPDAHAWFSGWHADYPDPDGFYLGLLKLGLPLYCDEETDAMLERARASRDRDERLRLYREFERIWIGAARGARADLLRPPALLRRPGVHGLRLNPMGAFHLEQVVVEPSAARVAV